MTADPVRHPALSAPLRTRQGRQDSGNRIKVRQGLRGSITPLKSPFRFSERTRSNTRSNTGNSRAVSWKMGRTLPELPCLAGTPPPPVTQAPRTTRQPANADNPSRQSQPSRADPDNPDNSATGSRRQPGHPAICHNPNNPWPSPLNPDQSVARPPVNPTRRIHSVKCHT